MKTAARVLALALTLVAAGPAAALGGQNMVLGRMVTPRADAPSVAPTTHVRALYLLHCAGCHRADGAGAPEAYVPDLRQAGRFLALPEGRRYLVSVPGVMGAGLSDAQVAQLSNWLLATLAAPSVPAGHQPYTAAEVATARAQAPVDVAQARRGLMQQAQARGLPLD